MAAHPLMIGRLALRLALLGTALGLVAVWLALLAGTRFVLAPELLYSRWQDGQIDIILADTEGRIANLTPGPGRAEEPAWSPDGAQIVFVRPHPPNGDQLILMSATGRNVTQLTHTIASNNDPLWLPDGETLIYRFERVAERGHYDVFTLHLPTGTFRNLTDDNPTNTQLAVSPDGSQIAYTYDNRTVRVARLPYGEVILETSNSTRSPSWSPDSTRVAYVGPRDRFASSVIDTLYIIEAQPDAEPVRYIQADLNNLDHPRWSPDGTQIAFLAEPLFYSPSRSIGPDPRQVHLFDLATGAVRQVTNTRGRAVSFQWSPDGERLLFQVFVSPADNRVCITTLATGATTCPPTLTQVLDSPRWRPAPR